MDDAWLDSLSEDWISQPRSAGSPIGSLPSLPSSSRAAGSSSRSRIPLHSSRKQSRQHDNSSSSLPLSERSPNDINIPLSQRGLRRPSKLRNDISKSLRGRRLSRTISAGSTQSVQHNTVQHKSLSSSPQKSRHLQDTPEWKRRLLHGDVGYGEQRDLFSPGGLESIFRPPPPRNSSLNRLPERSSFLEDAIMRSSPPPYHNRPSTIAESPTPSASQEGSLPQRKKEPKGVTYKLADMSGDQFSEGDLSQGSSFRPQMSTSMKASPQPADVQSSNQGNRNILVERPLENNGTEDPRRLVSGQSDIHHENLSPIYVSRHNNLDGNIDYSAIDASAAELQERLEELNAESRELSGKYEEPSQLPPGNVTNNTEDFARNGQFINLRRGGDSDDDSFRRRMLSPSSVPLIDESALLREQSIEASTLKLLPTFQKALPSKEFETDTNGVAPLPSVHTPDQSPKKNGISKTPSLSPLKLFGDYDTFTNQTLLRRLSQFENNEPERDRSSGESVMAGESTNHTQMNEAYIAPSSPIKATAISQCSFPKSGLRKTSNFGDGDLDRFQFSEEVAFESSHDSGEDLNAELPGSVHEIELQETFRFNLQPLYAVDSVMPVQNLKGKSVTTNIRHSESSGPADGLSTTNSSRSAVLDPSERHDVIDTPRKQYDNERGKRLPRSPMKDPTPKRRRTLHKTDISHATFTEKVVDFVAESHQEMQSILSKKRKDAKHDNDLQSADPQVMASRQILRPRVASIQRRNLGEGYSEDSMVDKQRNYEIDSQQRDKIARVQAELDAADSSKGSLKSGQAMNDQTRKGSVTTQDFLDEAKKIMAGIRGKAHRRSGLASVEESESDTDRRESVDGHLIDEESLNESTKEPFSRPPSREGRAVLPRLPREQQDPVLLNHLRKYEELSDVDGLIASSMKSIGLAKEAVNAANALDQLASETLNRVAGRAMNPKAAYESDPPNTQITEYPELQRKRKHSISSGPTTGDEFPDAQFQSHGSNASSGASTERSIPTGSSRGSESRRVIPPNTVSHLIPEQLAGMVFDREKHIWVKQKTADGQTKEGNFLPSDGTDEDPFGDIPDLSVDMTQEMQRITAIAAKKREEAKNSGVQAYQKTQIDAVQERRVRKLAPARASEVENAPSSEPSKFTRFSSSGSNRETHGTRLTSWGDEQDPMAKSSGNTVSQKPSHKTQTSERVELLEEAVEEVEHEISINESRISQPATRRKRHVTISFSSPLASIINHEGYDEDTESDIELLNNKVQHDEDTDVDENSVIITQPVNGRKSFLDPKISSQQPTFRRSSLPGYRFQARPVSRIDEQDEDSFVQKLDERNGRNVSLVLTTPMPSRHGSTHIATIPPASVAKVNESLYQLSPMSDFTMNQPEESFALEFSYVASRRDNHSRAANTTRSLSLSVKELVQRITDVEPYEPFWEHIKRMELKAKNLQTLHMLSKFCGQLEELDVSDNQIAQLHGAPTTIRNLRISRNSLSDLTSWHSFQNLQYIDVSNNNITNLEGFKNLVHLRAIRADNNQIQSLDGVLQLDGLISLRLRNNVVESLNFEGTSLVRLSELDLKGNRVQEVIGLKELLSLATLNLEDNNIRDLVRNGNELSWALKYLKLSGNHLEQIDVSSYPNLRLLYLDRNRLGRISGLLKTKHLDSLSMREQQEGSIIDISFLDEAFEVRKLFLSGNLLKTFVPKVDFLNLQYLELANCGLETLPIEFGQMMTNIRVLNLNFNALREIAPLLGIVRLKKLHLAGNRLSRLRKTTNVLAQFSNLTKVDLRNNPLTLGFYPISTERRLVVHAGPDEEDNASIVEPFTLEEADRERDVAYAGRLDMETRMRRRVFEMLILGGCKRVKILDGLRVESAGLGVKDAVWEELVRAGVLLENAEVQEPGVVEGGETGKEEKVEDVSERWQAEDSFA